MSEATQSSQIRDSDAKRGPLHFTGNWFIDAGILGFVNLMEEVYGWSLEELNKRLMEEPEKVYYGYFPFAYVYYNLAIRSLERVSSDLTKLKKSKKLNTKEQIRKLEDTVNAVQRLKQKWIMDFRKKVFGGKIVDPSILILPSEQIWDNLKKVATDIMSLLPESAYKKTSTYNKTFKIVKAIKGNCLPPLQTPPGFRNFYLYNPAKDPDIAVKYLVSLIRGDINYLKKSHKKDMPPYLDYLDANVFPFSNSPKEFTNQNYSPTRVTDINKISPIPYWIVVLSIYLPAIPLYGQYTLFYTNNLEACYIINKRIRKQISSEEEKEILVYTWESIMDTIYETKSMFNLNEMYIIQFSFENIRVKDVEYIGIPKLKAALLMDDIIRDNLNKRATYKKGKELVSKWLLLEFVNGKQLTPFILENLKQSISKKDIARVSVKTAITAIVVDSVLNFTNDKHVFTRIPWREKMDTYEKVKKMKQDVARAHRIRIQLRRIVSNMNRNLRENLAYRLIEFIQKEDRYSMVNLVLRILVENRERIDKMIIKRILEFVRNLEQGDYWKVLGVVFVYSLLQPGGEESE